jgi:pimeloyl-ACP methyl ester carboxylesterase
VNFLTVQSRHIEYVRLQAKKPKAQTPTIVMLHEGLGSIAMWRDFPQKVSDATGCEVLVYSRYGYGNSDPLEVGNGVDYLHKEALETLTDILEQLNIKKPILFGHSDGGSIALINAGGAHCDLTGVIVMAPHVMVEALSIEGLEVAKKAYLNSNLRERLSKYHANVDSAFYGWNNVWMHPEFMHWNIEHYLHLITCPVLAIQGVEDEYGTMEQIDIIGRKVKRVELLKLSQCGHSPHKDQLLAVLEAVTSFVKNS